MDVDCATKIFVDEAKLNWRPWSDLPWEILSSIADRLALIELLSFRGTCKDFRSASSTATAKIQSIRNPWLLFHETDTPGCQIVKDHITKTYYRIIPDLQGAICLASYQGWLLLYKLRSVFFFCPFLLVKITLPDFPHKQMDGHGHVAAFSDVPTSPNCIVSVIDEMSTTMNLITRGETAWTQHQATGSKRSLRCATFDQKTQTFYYMDDDVFVMTYSVVEKEWKRYTIVRERRSKPKNKDKYTLFLPYLDKNHVFRDYQKEFELDMDLDEDEYVAVCGLSHEHKNNRPQEVYRNEVLEFSPMKTRVRRAIWIQPRFFLTHKNQLW